jgi:hypothetical protein
MRADFSTRRHVGRPRLVDLLLLALGLTTLGWSALAAASARRDLETVRAAVQQLRAHASEEERRLRELEDGRHDRADPLARQAAQTLASPPPRILADLEPTIPAAARLEALTLTYGHEAVELEVKLLARTPETYDDFVARVERSGLFGDLAFGSENRTGEMKVTLRARYRPEEGS